MQVSTTQNAPSAPYNPLAGMGSTTEGSLGKEDFMQLLVAQLANQDPLNPTDSTAFTAQLAQFSSLEQLVNVNRGLEMLAITQTAATSAQVMGFIGREIEFAADSISTDGVGGAPVKFDLTADATDVTVTIKDSSGKVVRTIEAGEQSAGIVSVDWDGKDGDGNLLAAGTYTFQVKAKSDDGSPVDVTTRSTGVVQGIVFDKGYPELVLDDGRKVKLGDVFGAKAAPETPVSSADPSQDNEE